MRLFQAEKLAWGDAHAVIGFFDSKDDKDWDIYMVRTMCSGGFLPSPLTPPAILQASPLLAGGSHRNVQRLKPQRVIDVAAGAARSIVSSVCKWMRHFLLSITHAIALPRTTTLPSVRP
jgi:hypothetical protein